MKQKRLPGPVGTSCLTCKRRRKKCDQGRPMCQRCIEVGYDCLGYDHIKQRKAIEPDPRTSQCRSEESVVQAPIQDDKDNCDVRSDHHQLPENIFSQPPPVLSPGFPDASLYGPTGYITSADNQPDSASVTNPYLSLVVTTNDRWNVLPRSSNSVPGSEEDHPSPYHVSNQHRFNFLSGAWTARTLSTLSPDMRQLIPYVLEQYERVLDSVYFRPRDHQAARLREMVVGRLQESSITRCAIVLVVKMFDSILKGESHNDQVSFKRSVERFERQLQMVKAQPLSPTEVQHLLNGFLEATFLKMRVSNGYNVYQLLRNAAPTFLEIVYSDPNLWPNSNGPPMVCMSKITASTRIELGHFALVDILCSMVYGLPQVVDYETATPSSQAEFHPVEWIICCPLEFQVCIAEMNQRYSRSYVAPDWQIMEHRLLSYKVPVIAMDTAESWKTIARLAVVESWRQVLLIYLYMAICGVPSDDPRVQSAVRQTFRLLKTIKREEPPKINVPLMVQFLIAGACTRDEKQRAFTRERLLEGHDNEVWMMSGPELVPVLDHLWHGAAANGGSFRWSDYIMSRQVALPILI